MICKGFREAQKTIDISVGESVRILEPIAMQIRTSTCDLHRFSAF
jgi:hypothetical protein